jgi:RNA polymerase sigma factor (sigma-70 family)
MDGQEPLTFTTRLFRRIRDAAEDENAKKAAFDELTTHYWRILTAWARGRNCKSEAAEDIAQDVLTRVWKYLNNFNEAHSKPRQWMYGIFKRCLSDLRKQEHRWSSHLTPEQEEDLRSPAAADEVVRVVMTQELMELAEADAERKFPTQFPAYKELDLGKTPAEVAARFGLKETSVIQYHGNVRRYIRQELERLNREHGTAD